MRLVPLLVLASALACGPARESARETATPAVQPVTRQLGSWSGTGNSTLGFVSESGSFRITWNTRNRDDARPGSFQLTLRSGISGRPLKVIADEHGGGGGRAEFGDDPRMYEFLVESGGIDWTVSVEETFAAKP
jgi:hypothetical protein